MNLQPKEEQEVDVNLTPLIDVVFLLLIFFMVSTTFVKESEIDITLPQAAQEIPREDLEVVEVSIDRDGNYFVDEQALVNAQLETVKAALTDAVAQYDDPTIVISADAEASHQGVVRILDAARQLGLYRVTFATSFADDAE